MSDWRRRENESGATADLSRRHALGLAVGIAAIPMPAPAQANVSAQGGAAGTLAEVPSFPQASRAQLPAGVSVVRTQGFHAPGIGAANYVFDPAVNEAYVARHAVSAFLAADGRGFHLADGAVSPEMLGAGTGDPAADTVAFRAACAEGRHIQGSIGATYYLSADVTMPQGPKGGRAIRLSGAPQPAGNLPRIVVTGPGVTPFPVDQPSYIQGFAFEFAERGTTPAVAGDSWGYARALSFPRATIRDDRNMLRLSVGGGLNGAVTAGSVVVVLDDRARTDDFWVNNFENFDRIFVIDEVVDDRTAILRGKRGTVLADVPIHVRGGILSTQWREYQPSEIVFEGNALGAIPGYAVTSMGAQKLQVVRNFILGSHGPHLGLLFAGSEAGWSQGGTYHQCVLAENMLFFNCGGVAINGWADGRIAHNQFDQGASQNRALAQFFPNREAVYALANCIGCAVDHNSAEDSSSADGMKLFQCIGMEVRGQHAHDLTPEAYSLHLQGCLNCSHSGTRNSGGSGDGAKLVRFTGHGVNGESEVEQRQGGRGGSGMLHRHAGVFGRLAPYLDSRDGLWRRFDLPAGTVRGQGGATHLWRIPHDDLAGSDGFSLFLIEALLLDHGLPWAEPGTAPVLRIKVDGAAGWAVEGVDLARAAGSYLSARGFGAGVGPFALTDPATGRPADLLVEIAASKGRALDALPKIGDLHLYLKVAGVRA